MNSSSTKASEIPSPCLKDKEKNEDGTDQHSLSSLEANEIDDELNNAALSEIGE